LTLFSSKHNEQRPGLELGRYDGTEAGEKLWDYRQIGTMGVRRSAVGWLVVSRLPFPAVCMCVPPDIASNRSSSTWTIEPTERPPMQPASQPATSLSDIETPRARPPAAS